MRLLSYQQSPFSVARPREGIAGIFGVYTTSYVGQLLLRLDQRDASTVATRNNDVEHEFYVPPDLLV